MFGTLSGVEALPAAIDEFAKASAEPGDRNLSLRHEGCEQLRPLALVAIKAPGLDQLGAGVFLVRISTEPSLAHDDGWCHIFPFPAWGKNEGQRVSHGVIVD